MWEMENIFMLVDLVIVMCLPALVTSCLCQLKRRRAVGWLACVLFLGVGAVEGSTLSVTACVPSCVSVLCVCVCISGTHEQLCY